MSALKVSFFHITMIKIMDRIGYGQGEEGYGLVCRKGSAVCGGLVLPSELFVFIVLCNYILVCNYEYIIHV